MPSEGDSRKGEALDISTYNGEEPSLWQFSVHRTSEEIIITQARGPVEKFSPVVKRYTIEDHQVGPNASTFHHSVIRRVWHQDPDKPKIQSQRSEGHQIDLLFRDKDGWHIDHPEPSRGRGNAENDAEYEPTDYPGITVAGTFLRSEEGPELKFVEEREYRVTDEILTTYEEVYVLACHEVNEESEDSELWEVENAIAYRLLSIEES